ncbi:MAG: metallophosphatase family protein [Desulfobulbaceae bacterium]|nr:metallophosphatase family protein [Desulfobulbaceae bacterium]HIJ90836.1 metallophosphoesterase family protein [Deltaproteobacteria bacterium]
MTSFKIGILSDTHLTAPSETFKKIAEACFHDTDMILHAGDLTDPEILTVFSGKEVHAVHGNMCSTLACQHLPSHKEIKVGGFTIGLIHRVGNTYDFEKRLIDIFPEADCIVYGHTHKPVCHRLGGVLYINPGSFTGTGYYGAGGTFAVLEVGETLQAQIYQIQAKR